MLKSTLSPGDRVLRRTAAISKPLSLIPVLQIRHGAQFCSESPLPRQEPQYQAVLSTLDGVEKSDRVHADRRVGNMQGRMHDSPCC